MTRFKITDAISPKSQNRNGTFRHREISLIAYYGCCLLQWQSIHNTSTIHLTRRFVDVHNVNIFLYPYLEH
jgi:hypothetical protein